MAKPSLSPADTAEVMSTIGVNFNGFCVAGFTSSDVDKFQSISAMPEFRKFSNEELRLVDLAQKQTNSLVAK
ncbi:hypothetical protein OIDMADRAFT_16220 [Oidiodendron maius Zn]|uniref:Uncharacterized protein n=1 Tax=Oidiodendron maius (strain Zn) TaxID=913774 RepID=A0A0C3HXG5_OIDMZ|nr:hypothetical protein OIDMADRAFT_16220 [Oidiodendron maius Zn]